jgi:hypothetical protein
LEHVVAESDAPDGLAREGVAAYIADEIARAFGAHDRAATGTVQRVLPLGEMLALFNLADQFGLIDQVRADLDRRRGSNAYLAFSEAMKTALLDRGFGSEPGTSGPRPGGPPRNNPPGPRPAGPARPPDRNRDNRPGPPGRQGRNDNRPPRGGGRQQGPARD